MFVVCFQSVFRIVFGQLARLFFGQSFDQIFGQGFDQGVGEGKKCEYSVQYYPALRNKQNIINTKQLNSYVLKPCYKPSKALQKTPLKPLAAFRALTLKL